LWHHECARLVVKSDLKMKALVLLSYLFGGLAGFSGVGAGWSASFKSCIHPIFWGIIGREQGLCPALPEE
jgi:hypothetical protein